MIWLVSSFIFNHWVWLLPLIFVSIIVIFSNSSEKAQTVADVNIEEENNSLTENILKTIKLIKENEILKVIIGEQQPNSVAYKTLSNIIDDNIFQHYLCIADIIEKEGNMFFIICVDNNDNGAIHKTAFRHPISELLETIGDMADKIEKRFRNEIESSFKKIFSDKTAKIDFVNESNSKFAIKIIDNGRKQIKITINKKIVAFDMTIVFHAFRIIKKMEVKNTFYKHVSKSNNGVDYTLGVVREKKLGTQKWIVYWDRTHQFSSNHLRETAIKRLDAKLGQDKEVTINIINMVKKDVNIKHLTIFLRKRFNPIDLKG